MRSGKVVGQVWSSRKIDALPGGALVVVELEHPKETVVAFDPLACGTGEAVLIATGAACAEYFTINTPIDALVIASME